MGDYGSEADRINDMIRQHKDAYTSGLGDEANSLQTIATENWNSKNADYTAKFGHLAEGGSAEIAGAFGLKGIYKGGQNLKKLYNKYQNKASDGDDPLIDNKTGNPTNANSEIPENLPAEDVPQTGDAPQISTDQIASEDAFNFIRTEGSVDVPLTQRTLQPEEETEVQETSFMNRPAPALSEEQAQSEYPRIGPSDAPPQSTAPAPVEDLDEPDPAPLAGETENLLGDVGKKVGEDVGENIVKSGAGDLLAGAIPVLGEGILAVAGLVSIGEGLYHLFHHKTTQPTVSSISSAGPTAPSAGLTQKYALALPSIDSASEASASVSSF